MVYQMGRAWGNVGHYQLVHMKVTSLYLLIYLNYKFLSKI